MIRDAIEYCDKYWRPDPQSEVRKFANDHRQLHDFWESCENSDWMLELLAENEYSKNDEDKMDRVLEFLRCIKEEGIERHYPKNEYPYKHQQQLDRVNAGISKLKSWMKEGNVQGPLREIWRDAMDEVRDATVHAVLRLATEEFVARVQGKSEKEIRVLLNTAIDQVQQTRKATLKKQADMLRQILGNPFR